MQHDLNRIFSVLKTYENFETYMLNYDASVNDNLLRNHISLWISQFDSIEQKFIASVTAKLLEERFITKEYEISFISKLFQHPSLLNNGTMPYPLNIQSNGNSQKRLVQYYDSYKQNHNYTYSNDSFIYLDDFMFSGGRIFNDLSNWIPLQNITQNIFVVVIGLHTSALYDKEKKLNEKIAQNNRTKGLHSTLTFLTCYRWENRLYYKNQSDVLWPMESFFQNPNYISHADPQFKYRDGFIPTTQSFFTNNQDRVGFENICLKYGFQIINRCNSFNFTTRALGNHRYGYGFGGLFFSYKNCPNNTPLIFWWGSSNPSNPMYNQWHPLMPRRVYG